MASIFQPAHFEPTLLAVAMWRFLPPHLHAGLPQVRASTSAVAAAPTAVAAAAAVAATAAVAVQRAPRLVRAQAVIAPPPAAPVCGEASIDGALRPRVVRRYESRDERGRVWGMPNAGGRGQCFDCPNLAAPGNERCEACQRRLAETVHEVPSYEQLQRLQAGLHRALELACVAGRQRQVVDDSLAVLLAEIGAGRLPEDMQGVIFQIAEALLEDRLSDANRLCAQLARGSWDRHRDWLQGLRRLLAAAQQGSK